jgi:hypothetical protein
MEKRVAALLKFRSKLEASLRLAGNSRTFAGMIGEVVDCHAQVFYNDLGVVVTQIEDTEVGHRLINIWVAAGEMDGVLPLLDEAVDWGESVGAVVAVSTGRRGWGRIPEIIEQGWKPEMTLYTREI